MLQAVFLDIDDTLLDFNACACACIRQGLAQRGEVFRDEMFPTFLEINLDFWHRIERGEINRDYLAAHRFNTVFAALGLSHLDGPAFEVDFRRALNESAVLLPHAQETVAYLAARYPLYAATNGPQHQQENRLRRAGLLPYFQEVFTSETFGAEKPSRAFFDQCFARLPRLRPEEVLFIGDSLSADMAGGIAYGLTTCWFDPRGRDSGEIRPTYHIRDLRELRRIL